MALVLNLPSGILRLFSTGTGLDARATSASAERCSQLSTSHYVDDAYAYALKSTFTIFGFLDYLSVVIETNLTVFKRGTKSSKFVSCQARHAVSKQPFFSSSGKRK